MNWFEELNSEQKEERLSGVREAARLIQEGSERTRYTDEVNNHVHTAYSFSPYFPAKAAYLAWKAGLKAVGIMDHDSVAGAEELLEACALIGIGSTAGFELRVNFNGSSLQGRTFNNPDSKNIAYIAVHGIPKQHLKKAGDFLRPIQEKRNHRNRAMVERLNSLIVPFGLETIDFTKNVFGKSRAADGGSITERHILFAFAEKIIETIGKGKKLISFLEEKLSVEVKGTLLEYLTDPGNPHYIYDLLGILKSTFLPQIFIQPGNEECISVYNVVSFANNIGAIPAYAYLGDVTESPTGDKKAQKFEDDFLDLLFPELKEIGFKAVTYMPPRNTIKQLKRVQNLCKQYGFMEISGVDINSSRQSFNCPIILEPDFQHLVDATWALIAHEKLASADERLALFHSENPYSGLTLEERIRKYNEAGRKIDPHHPEKAETLLKREG